VEEENEKIWVALKKLQEHVKDLYQAVERNEAKIGGLLVRMREFTEIMREERKQIMDVLQKITISLAALQEQVNIIIEKHEEYFKKLR